jgi:hypothetical protein
MIDLLGRTGLFAALQLRSHEGLRGASENRPDIILNVNGLSPLEIRSNRVVFI